ncbi:hypothetical protein HKX48_002885 [Thoreauomyces humboldtii]|nr:hypothetical protein HKX48_002885 [Thoreauomyces humboldtii]
MASTLHEGAYASMWDDEDEDQEEAEDDFVSADSTISSTRDYPFPPAPLPDSRQGPQGSVLTSDSGSNLHLEDDSVDDDEEGDDEEYDEDMDLDTGGFSPAAKEPSHRVNVACKAHSPSDLWRIQKDETNHVCQLTGCGTDHAVMLLRAFRWDKEKLVEAFMEDSDRVLGRLGIPVPREEIGSVRQAYGAGSFECPICCDDDVGGAETVALQCGHRFCRECSVAYVVEKISQGESGGIQCMEGVCKLKFDEDTLVRILPPETLSKYRELTLRAFVSDMPYLKWCPAPDCGYAVECHADVSEPLLLVPAVRCHCDSSFCFSCTVTSDHRPCPCPLVKIFLSRSAEEALNANWYLTNDVRTCPKCAAMIEKNGGCSHMHCRKCQHEFCWLCGNDWFAHNTTSHGCNTYSGPASGSGSNWDARGKGKEALERYLHHWTRYTNHEKSSNLAARLVQRSAIKMEAFQSRTTLTWIEVQFMRRACDVLLEARSALKWTYAFAYFLPRSDNQTALFEANQQDLEVAVEDLNELLEQPMPGVKLAEDEEEEESDGEDATTVECIEVARVESAIRALRSLVLDKMIYVNARKDVLLDDAACGLWERRWEFSVDTADTLWAPK